MLDAAGFDWVVLETVGVGQVEVDIAAAADSTVVVTNPGWGDAVQANKAGLLEVADVLVVNKADRPGAADTEADLRSMLHLRPHASGSWMPPVVATSATERTGVETLVQAITDHRSWQLTEDRLGARRRERLARELERRILEEIADAVHKRMAEIGFTNTVERVWNRELSPSAAAEELRPSFG